MSASVGKFYSVTFANYFESNPCLCLSFVVMSLLGTTKVVASMYVKKYQMSKDNNHGSITIVRVGLAVGVEGPRFFLAKGEKVDHVALKKIDKDHSAPAGSKVIELQMHT